MRLVCPLVVVVILVGASDVTKRILIQRNDSSTHISGLERSYKARHAPLEVFHVPWAELNATLLCEDIMSKHAVLSCEPDVLMKFDAPNSSPNDPGFPQQYGTQLVQAQSVWQQADFGSVSVIVCVIDTGTDLTHPDIQANLWVNLKEKDGRGADSANNWTNGIDDDDNGIVDDIYGASFVDGSTSGDCQDENGHGTFVAGVIGAVGNNGIGVTGIQQVASIMTCRFMDANGNGWVSDAIRCIEYCISNGASVLSNSWGGVEYSAALQAAVDYATKKGVLFVASAGNEGVNTDLVSHFPSSFPNENVLAVAALNQSGGLWKFTNFGNLTVDLAAPGVQILNLGLSGSYVRLTGTSMAVPHVSGCAALLLAQYQRNHLNITGVGVQVKYIMLETSTALPATQADMLMHGILDCYAAWKRVPSGDDPP